MCWGVICVCVLLWCSVWRERVCASPLPSVQAVVNVRYHQSSRRWSHTMDEKRRMFISFCSSSVLFCCAKCVGAVPLDDEDAEK